MTIELDQVLRHEDPQFANAILSIVKADPRELVPQLQAQPELAKARSHSDHRSTLLHYIAANGIEDELQLAESSIYQRLTRSDMEPSVAAENIIQCVKILIDSGADVDALAETYGGGAQQTTLNLLVSSAHPMRSGVAGPITQAICAAGAKADGIKGDSSPLTTALAFGNHEAANALIASNAKVDNILFAAAAGDVKLLAEFLKSDQTISKNLDRCRNTWQNLPDNPKELAELALVYACMCNRIESVRYLVECGVDPNAMPPGSHATSAPLHTAAYAGQLATVEYLVQLGCDPTLRDSRYKGNAVDWAREGGDHAVLQCVGQYLPKFLRQQLGESPHIQSFIRSVHSENKLALEQLLAQTTLTPAELNGPWFHFDAPAVVQVRKNLDLVDMLTTAGADINQRSLWWAGGYSVLHEIDSSLAKDLEARGAEPDVWSAAEHADLATLRKLLAETPKLLSAPGPDGKTPLHCASTISTAAFLISEGASLDARCIDHESTPVQYMLQDHPEVARFLVQKGCRTEIMLAAALGDVALLQRMLDEDPNLVEATVSREYFPTAAADHIYAWVLGRDVTPHQVAVKFKKKPALEKLMEASSPTLQLLNWCLIGDESKAHQVSEDTADSLQALTELPQHLQQQLAHAARNSNAVGVALLLRHGFNVQSRGQHDATALHWASFHGAVAMVHSLLEYKPELETKDGDFKSTPLQWALHGMRNGWHKDRGDFPGVVRALVGAGARTAGLEKTGDPTVDALLAESHS